MSALILASRSPRRAKILEWAGVKFRVCVPREVQEARNPGESPERMVRRLALEKAQWASKRSPGSWVLAADTTVALGRKVFEKPKDVREAKAMLIALAGREHQVWTGVAILKAGRKASVFVERTGVRFGSIPAKELKNYLRTRVPYDKAGGYDIQGRAGEWIAGIRGDYFNVMGLPLQRTLVQLRKTRGR